MTRLFHPIKAPVFALGLVVSLTSLSFADGMRLDAVQEKRAAALSHELRCMVCQNQSIDESDAPLARDLRQLVREKILSGASDQAIKSDLVARYGEFILLNPAFEPSTYALWGAPLLTMVIGLGLAWRWIKNQTPEA